MNDSAIICDEVIDVNAKSNNESNLYDSKLSPQDDKTSFN